MAKERKNNYVILGLLSHTPMTGYEIKKRLETTMRFFWNASYGSIYPTLQNLEEDGLIKSSRTIENGREKITYLITESGRSDLREWLKKGELKDELRYETLVKLFFGSEVGPNVSIEHIQEFEDKIAQDLPLLQRSVEQLKALDQEEAHKYYMLTAQFGVKVYEAYLEWCEDTKKILTESDNGFTDEKKESN